MRLDKFLCDCTGMSRREATIALRGKRVLVNGANTMSGKYKLSNSDAVELDGAPLQLARHLYLMLNKPAGYVCANTDAEHPTVTDLLDFNFIELQRHRTVQIVGRLDMDTTGLLLITTDGEWNHRVTAPNQSCKKTYFVELAEEISEEQIAQLEQGIKLRSEPKPTLPCKITQKSPTQLNITISEGRYHQVKRMFAAVNNKVINLHRWQIGALSLDEQLEPGEYRPLTSAEVAAF